LWLEQSVLALRYLRQRHFRNGRCMIHIIALTSISDCKFAGFIQQRHLKKQCEVFIHINNICCLYLNVKNVFKQDTRKKSYTFRVGQIQYHRIPSIRLATLCRCATSQFCNLDCKIKHYLRFYILIVSISRTRTLSFGQKILKE